MRGLHRQRRGIGAVMGVVAVAVALAGTACGSGGDDDAEGQVADPTADTTTTSAEEADTEEAVDTGSGSSDRGTDLDTSASDAATDIERQVSETLSDLGADEVDGDTVITLPDEVLFDFGQAVLRPDATATLDRIAQAIVFFEGAPVRVAGHTDSRGSEAYNQQLSEDRAQSVVDYLVGAGVDGGRITAEGFGETQPVAPNENADGSDDPGGRAQNRRVEVVIEGVDPADVGR